MPRTLLGRDGVLARPPLLRQLLAHGSIALLLIATLFLLQHREPGGTTGAGLYLVAASAFFCGFALSHIVHEWGHFAGAVLTGSSLTIKPRIHPLFFDFDYLANGRKQFLALSIGGLLGNIALLVALLLLTTSGSLVLAALLAAVIGQLVYVLVLELPVSLGVLAGREPMDILAAHFGQGRPLFARATAGGIAAAALTLLVY